LKIGWVDYDDEDPECRQQAKQIAELRRDIVGWVNRPKLPHGSNLHNPHGIEHEAEQEAIHRKLNHDLIPRPDRPFLAEDSRPSGLG
jgi:hypothetical protein